MTFWEKHRDSITDSLWQAIICLTVALALCQSAMDILHIPMRVAASLAIVAGLFVAFELLAKKWWLGPAALAAVGLCGFILWRFFPENFAGITAHFSAFFEYVAAGQYQPGDYAGPLWPAVALAYPAVGFIAYMLGRKARHFLPLALVCAAAFGAAWVLDYHVVYPWALVCLAAVLFKGGYGYYLRDHDRAAAHGAPTAAIIALAAVLLATSFLPSQNSDLPTWRWLRAQVGDVNDLIANYTGLRGPIARDLFTADEMGYGPLGGPTELDSEFYLRVTAPSGTLLRGSIQSRYDGRQWHNSLPWGQRRFGSLMWSAQHREIYNLDIPVWDELTLEARQLLADEQVLTIRHLRNTTSTLFGAGRVHNVISRAGDSLQPYFDLNGEMFSKYYVARNYSYQVETQLIRHNSPGFDTLMHRLTAKERPMPAATREKMEAYYLGLPDTLPGIVRQRAQELAQGAPSQYAQAAAIRDYLQGMSYTLTPSTVPDDADFVAHLLETQEGYCTYFATAMAVMARCIGIPSRYVQGFMVPEHNDANTVYISGEQAHAWAELYFEGIGWVPMEATPSGGVPSQPTPVRADSDIGGMPATPPPADDGADDLVIDIPAPAQPVDMTWLYTVLIALGALALVAAIALPWALHRRSLSARRIKRLYPDPAQRMEAYFANALAVLREFEDRTQPGDTPYAIAKRIDRWLQAPSGTVRDMADIVVRMRYGNQPPTQEDFAWADRFTHDLEGLLRQFLGWRAYIGQRVLRRKLFGRYKP